MKLGRKINEASENQIKAGVTGNIRLAVVLKKSDQEKLSAVAEREQLTISDLVRRAVAKYLQTYEQTGQI